MMSETSTQRVLVKYRVSTYQRTHIDILKVDLNGGEFDTSEEIIRTYINKRTPSVRSIILAGPYVEQYLCPSIASLRELDMSWLASLFLRSESPVS